MKHLGYVSTRGIADRTTFNSALLMGLAPDGGLYLPERIPRLSDAVWQASGSFSQLASEVMSPWLRDEVPERALSSLLEDALSFPVPLVPLKGGGWEGIHVLELFHGPTLSFKDFGARVMARLMDYFLPKETVTVLVATSGDTGSAVADGFADRRSIRVAVLFPEGQVSPTQERQLVVARPGVRTYAVGGTFDDCQRMVKALLVEDDLYDMRLSAANSINVGRLLPQMLYYVWAVVQGRFKDATFCVPCGNLGNLTGGVMAALAGLPVRQFIAAHNQNDGFPRFLQGGSSKFGASIRTISNAMDVGTPSNFERLRALLPPEKLRQMIKGASVSNEATRNAMREVYDATGYIADPHTAVALEATRRHRASGRKDGPFVVLATAHPAKFPEIVMSTLGFTPETPQRLSALWQAPTSVVPLAATCSALKNELLAWH